MPPILVLAIHYVWFFGAAVAAIKALAWRRRATALVAKGAVTTQDVARFTRVTAIAISFLVALGVLTLWAGYPVLFCSPFRAPRTLPDLAATSLIVAGWTGTLIWVWFGRGDELLARLGPALTGLPRWTDTKSPRRTRFLVTALILLPATAIVFMPYTTPAKPFCDWVTDSPR